MGTPSCGSSPITLHTDNGFSQASPGAAEHLGFLGRGGNNPPLVTIPKKGSVLLKHPQHWGVPFPLQMWGTRKAAGRQRLFAIRNEVLIRHRMPAMCSSPVASFIAGRAMQKNTSHSFSPPPPLYILFMPLTNSIFRSWNHNKASVNAAEPLQALLFAGSSSPRAHRGRTAPSSSSKRLKCGRKGLGSASAEMDGGGMGTWLSLCLLHGSQQGCGGTAPVARSHGGSRAALQAPAYGKNSPRGNVSKKD